MYPVGRPLQVGDTLVQRTFDPLVGVLATWRSRAARKRTAARLCPAGSIGCYGCSDYPLFCPWIAYSLTRQRNRQRRFTRITTMAGQLPVLTHLRRRVRGRSRRAVRFYENPRPRNS